MEQKNGELASRDTGCRVLAVAGVRTLFPFLKVERSLILVDREIIMGACNGGAGHVGPGRTCCAFHVLWAACNEEGLHHH